MGSFSRNPRNSRFGNIVPGVFTPVLAKHTKSFNLIDTLSVGVDRIQRSFEPMQQQVEQWRSSQLTPTSPNRIRAAKVGEPVCMAFINGTRRT